MRLALALGRELPEFFLTGGAVLSGWILGHRSTEDLDFFTISDEAMRAGDSVMRRVAAELHASIQEISSSPDFRRYLVALEGQSLKVDLVRDRVPQVTAKVLRDGISMDSVEEIFVNKVCTLVERSEVRDLVDVMHLERLGMRVETALFLAQKKDGGVTPASLAWLLHSFPIPERIPGNVAREELIAYRNELEQRMLELARPSSK